MLGGRLWGIKVALFGLFVGLLPWGARVTAQGSEGAGRVDSSRLPMRVIDLPSPQRESRDDREKTQEGGDSRQRLRESIARLERELRPMEIPDRPLPVRVGRQMLSNMLDALLRDAPQGWMVPLLEREAKEGQAKGHNQEAREGSQEAEPALWVVTDSGAYRLDRQRWTLVLEARGAFIDSLCLRKDSLFRHSALLILGGVDSPRLKSLIALRTALGSESQNTAAAEGEEPVATSFVKGGRRVLMGFSGYAWSEADHRAGRRGSFRRGGLR